LGPRELAKWAAHALATLLVAPLFVPYWIRAVVSGRDRALQGATEALALLPGLPGQYLRRAFLARVLAHCDQSACIGFGVLFSRVGTSVGANVYIGPRCQIGLATIEKDVLLAAGVHVTSEARSHCFEDAEDHDREEIAEPRPVRIGEGSWVGESAVLAADVGRQTVVGAGAVVTGPLPDRVIAVGVPARVARRRGEAGGAPDTAALTYPCQPAPGVGSSRGEAV
jgi:acetyltransferase-like isoleucine patch superfamily enzyme